MRNLSVLILFLSSLLPFQLSAQSTDFFYGKILDAVTKEPLPFASILVREAKMGVFSNADGDFKIVNLPSFQADSLKISFIGYKNCSIPIKNLSKNKTNTILLNPISIGLKEVDIVGSAKKLDSKSILRQAIKNIPSNYVEKPFNYISYYRDYQKKDKKYYNLNEAIVQTLDTGIQIVATENKYRLFDFKKNTDFKRFQLPTSYDSLVSPEENANKFIKYGSLPDQGGNELFVLMGHDPIRNFRSQSFSFVDVFSKDFIPNHLFSRPTPVYDNNRMLYKIDFTAKPFLTGDSLLISGSIFIQPFNFAIHKLEYSGAYLLKGGIRKKMFDITVEYGSLNAQDPRMRLKYISFNNIFDVTDKTDTSYFRIIRSELSPIDSFNSNVVIEFNHTIDPHSAIDKDKFEILLDGKLIKAQTIKVIGRKAIIQIKDQGSLKPQLTISPKNIRDLRGEEFNKRKIMEFYQYRELFVQEFNQPVALKESYYLKDLPLEQSLLSNYVGSQNYWMNSPVNSDTLEVNAIQQLNAYESNSGEEENQSQTIQEKLDRTFSRQEIPKNDPNVHKTDFLFDQYLTNQEKSIGSDQVFVHLDKSTYMAGDTIYFQAYIRNHLTGIFSSKSSALYALLLNAQKVIVDSARFKINNSTSSGWMALPTDAAPGKYHFAAFSGDMQNYDPADAFHFDIQVKGLIVNKNTIEVTLNKGEYVSKDTLVALIQIRNEKGKKIPSQKFRYGLSLDNNALEYHEAQTNQSGLAQISYSLPDSLMAQPFLQVIMSENNKKDSIVKEIAIPSKEPYFELHFLPEGGTFIEGLTQRMGFNATYLNGQPVPIVGLLKERSGMILDTIRSGAWGPGQFSCIAQPGLYVELIKGTGSGRVFPLPVPEVKGFALSVSPSGKRSFAIEIQSDKYDGETVTVACIMNTTLVLSKQLMISKKQRLVVKTDELPAGVAQITLFDKDLKTLAQRLIAVNADKRLNFKIKADSVTTSAQETQLSISVTDDQGSSTEGIFSIAITDSLKALDSENWAPGIEYAFNFHPYLLRNLPSKVQRLGIENLSDTDRDLLFMIYGWSQFTWDFSRKDATYKQLADYEFLKMKVLSDSKKHSANRILNLVSLEGPSIQKLKTDPNGEITLPLDSLPEITRTVTLMPVAKDKNNAREAMLSIPYNEQYFKSIQSFTSQFPIKKDEQKVRTVSYKPSFTEKTYEIPEIIVTSHRRVEKIYHDQYEERYQSANVKSLDPEMIWSSSSLELALRKRINILKINNAGIILRPPRSFFSKEVPALIVLDGYPLFSEGWSMVNNISVQEITSLTVLMGPQGVTHYGEAAQGGVLFVNTRSNNPDVMKLRTKWISQNSKDRILISIELYRPVIQFYNPTKSKDDNIPVTQRPETIYWNPEVYFNGKDPVTLKFKNSTKKGPISVVINGISFTNLMGSERQKLAL